jgi:hypothetical protein
MTNDVRQRGRDEVRASGKAIPIVYQGQRFPNRAALARYLAPLVAAGADRIEQVLWRPNGSR